jgi:hypothetical protein
MAGVAGPIDPEADPTYLAFENARQYGVGSLQRQAAEDIRRNGETHNDTQESYGLQQQDLIDKNTAQYRAQGFGLSGLRAYDESKIRADIANKSYALLHQYNNTNYDINSKLAENLAQSTFDQNTQQIAARNRLTQANAKAGIGI